MTPCPHCNCLHRHDLGCPNRRDPVQSVVVEIQTPYTTPVCYRSDLVWCPICSAAKEPHLHPEPAANSGETGEER